MSTKLPRTIKPSQIVAGDLISVEFRKVEGVTMTNKGRVDKIEYNGNNRIAVTKENGRILTWDEKDARGQGITVTLHQRAPVPQTPMF